MSPNATSPAPLLEVRNVRVSFPVSSGPFWRRRHGLVRAVDGVTFSLHRGEILGLVGESGCGKTTLARSILQLIPPTAGSIQLDGRPLSGARPGEFREMQMVFQDPHASLNPRLHVEATLAEPLLVHRLCPREEVPQRVTDLMQTVGLDPDARRKYPHEFSGGQRQRIAIGRALALEPQVLIADEPISSLDVSVQAQILNLLSRLCRDRHLAMILISHDLSVVRHLCDRLMVMYLGKVVESGPAAEVISRPEHPYTRALVSAIPRLDPDAERNRQRIVLPGEPPSPLNPPAGCAFHPRCPHAVASCRSELPALAARPGDRAVACPWVDQIEATSGDAEPEDPNPPS